MSHNRKQYNSKLDRQIAVLPTTRWRFPANIA
jgi:hypothetical protein